MHNVLLELETEDIVIYSQQTYSVSMLKKCKDIFEDLVQKGQIEGAFYDSKWMCYSDVKHFGINFSLNSDLYRKHIGKELGITEKSMDNMLRCYAIYCNGEYIYSTIARQKIGVIIKFLERYKDRDFKLKQEEVFAISDFLAFINTPDAQIEQIVSKIRLQKNKEKAQRKLSPVANYLVIENEINSLYSMQLSDEVFKKWFPIYFWVNITFILPLRATEMLLTPRDCIVKEGDKTILKIRRTKLKKGKRQVCYNVEKDYEIFTYEIPNTVVARNILKYMELTQNQSRRFLFEYNESMLNEMVSLQAFNNLLEKFIREHIIDSRKYDFVKFATGIEEFEVVSAGDSRPIAMANLYFQNTGADICRQLADHVHINTSSGYYTNIDETIWASSVMQLQKRLNNQNRKTETDIKLSEGKVSPISINTSICNSERRKIDAYDLTHPIHSAR